jgi:hypothetical protein
LLILAQNQNNIFRQAIAYCFFWVIVSASLTTCSRPSACPSTQLTDATKGSSTTADPFSFKASEKKKGRLNAGFSKNKKSVDTKDRGNPFGYDPNYQYPQKKKEEKGLFPKKIMKTWKK